MHPEAGDANYGCSSDKKQELVCDPSTSKLQVWSACRGEKGCSLEGDSVRCDRTVARLGEACRPAKGHACSEDAKSELVCSPDLAWIPQRECTLVGCKLKANTVYCE